MVSFMGIYSLASPNVISTLVIPSKEGFIMATEFTGMFTSLVIVIFTKISFMFLSVVMLYTVPTCRPFIITGFEFASPCTLVYFANSVWLSPKKVFPFKKLKPSTNKTMAMAVKAPIFVSFEIFMMVFILA